MTSPFWRLLFEIAVKESEPILKVMIRTAGDVVLARQRAQALAQIAEFPLNRQTSFATALSEIARNALTFAGQAHVRLEIERLAGRTYLIAIVEDKGPGIQAVRDNGGKWTPELRLSGQGIVSARKLVKHFTILCPGSGGTSVSLGIPFPENRVVTAEEIGRWMQLLAKQKPRNLLEEMHYRNQELFEMLRDLQEKEVHLEQQLAETSRLNAALELNQTELENRVSERTARLQDLVNELLAFSYAVSHDLRAPLRAINGLTSTLIEDHVQDKSDAALALGARIDNATRRMDALINDLVTYTQASQVPVAVAPIDSQVLIGEIESQYRGALPCGAELRILGEFPRVQANATLLQTCIANLIENALKFCKPGEPPKVTVRGACLSNLWELRVCDCGVGIDPAHHRKIFGVFERLHGSEYPGTGIGLALVKRWVDKMNGTLGVDSDRGKGAQFWIRLQVERSQKQNATSPDPRIAG